MYLYQKSIANIQHVALKGYNIDKYVIWHTTEQPDIEFIKDTTITTPKTK